LSRSSLRRWAGPAIAGSLALVGWVLPVVATAATAASPGLVISQVYGGGGNAGCTNLLRQFEGAQSYGYLFDGLLGDLDHALASRSLLRR
jgi:hypothetical protein